MGWSSSSGARGRFIRAATGILVLAVTGACTEESPAELRPILPNIPDAGPALVTSNLDASVTFAPDAATPMLDAGNQPVELGLVPVAVTPSLDAGEPSLDAANQLAADVEAVAVGAHSVVIEYAWDELLPDGETPNSDVMSLLTRRVRLCEEAGVHVTLVVALVRGVHDRRPPPLRGRWSAPEVERGFRHLLESVLQDVAPAVRRVGFAAMLDVWLDSVDETTRLEATDFLVRGMDLAREIDGRAEPFAVGVETTLAGALAPSPELERVISASDVRLVQYLPSLTDGVVSEPDVAFDSLSSGAERLANGAGALPLVLHKVGYPSGEGVGSSPEKQLAFYQLLFAQLGRDPGALATLDIWGTNEMVRDECEDIAAEFGQPISVARADLLCSLGLEDGSGKPKAAWGEFLAASARFFAQ